MKESRYRGVTWNKAADKWQSQVTLEGVRYYLGLFETEQAASEAYWRVRTGGSTEAERAAIRKYRNTPEDVLNHIEIEESGCWNWTGTVSANGYGAIQINRKIRLPHRLAYEILVAPIPEGLTIDHLCRNRLCLNPDHLEVVTRGENTLRASSPSGINSRKTHCIRGHPLVAENLVKSHSGRICKECSRQHCRNRRQRLKAAEEPVV